MESLDPWSLMNRHVVARLALLYSGLGLLQVGLRLLWSSWRVRRMWRMLEPVPSGAFPGGLLGILPDLVRNIGRLNDWRMESSQGLPYCKFYGFAFEAESVGLVVQDPQGVRHFLKDAFEKYTKPKDEQDIFFMFLRRWIGGGIFTVLHGRAAEDAGRSWMLQRKIAANIFTRGNFNTFMQEVFQTKSERLCQELAKTAENGQLVDMQCQFFNFTMDSIMQIFFGEESDTVGGAPHKYGRAFDEAHQSVFPYAVRARMFMNLSKFFLPWPFGGHDGLAWRIHAALSDEFRRFRAACRALDAESDRIVAACRADPTLPSRRDLLALFVQAEEKEHFSPKFLRDVVLSFVLAGRDTTACLLSWMFFELGRHPEVQERLHTEIAEKCGAGGSISFKSLAHGEMPYLHGVLYETLRLWPPVPVDSKVAAEDDVFPGGVRVPKGTKVIFLPYAMGRDPARWPEPLAFRPERWIPFAAPAPHEFPVFQAGPRICLGMDMAIFEAKVVVCNLLRRFSFELAPGQEEKITYTMKLTMNIRNDKGQKEDSEQLLMLLRPRGRQ